MSSARPSVEELSLLMYSNREVDILEYGVSENVHCSLKLLEVLKVVSPEEILVQQVAGDGDSQSWYNAMQHFYNDAYLSRPFGIKTSRVFQNRCYVWYDRESKSWNRVRVLAPQIKEDSSYILVWALDRGTSTFAKIEDMMEISPKYCMSTALAFRSHLVHIKPKSGVWPNDAIDYLKSVCIPGTRFHGVILACQEVDLPEESVTYYMSYGLVLSEATVQNKGTIQARLVAKGMAVPTGPCAGRHDLAYTERRPLCYNQKEMLKSLNKNSRITMPSHSDRNKNTARSGVEWTQPISGWRELTKNKSKVVSLKRIWMNTEYHAVPVNSVNLSEKFDGLAMYDHIPEVMQNRMGYVTISFEGMGPDCFYFQMQEKWPELDMMMSDLQEVAQKMPMINVGTMKSGMIAVARAIDEAKFSYWGRVIISSNSPGGNTVNAIFVDFGFELLVNLTSIRQLPLYLEKIPPFCRRAHLDFTDVQDPLMPSGVVTWTNQSEVVWKELIREWDRSDPIYYAWETSSSDGGLIQLDQFNQRLNFDRRSMNWCAGKRLKNRSYFNVDEFRQHPWLKQFYSSIGINVVYEKMENNCDFLSFVPIWKYLQKQGFIVPLLDPRKNPFATC